MVVQLDEKYLYGHWLAHPEPSDAIVISGVAGRYPSCDSIEELKNNLFAKQSLISNATGRWTITYDEMPTFLGTLKNVNVFDAAFFGIPYKEVDFVDPLCRLSLERAFEAIMDAGVNPSELRGKKVAVIVGNSFSETSMEFLVTVANNGDIMRGSFRESIANRISYWLGVNGPSYVTDTACSSSLTAMELAYRAIRTGDCESALVLGTNLCLNPYLLLQFYRLGLLSETGGCRAFDNDANGYVRSEAIVAVFLQKSIDARRIYATLVHAKTNCDGYKEFGITFPSRDIQKRVFQDFYIECGVDPSTVGYVEAHATGTIAGDPEESAAIAQVFCPKRKQSLLVGSVKSNLGHAESASGLVSISKAIIIMQTGIIPPNILYDTPRKEIEELINGTIKVVTENQPLEGNLVAVNNFGFGGANAHVLLKRYEHIKDNSIISLKYPRLVCFSGRNMNSIETLTAKLTADQIDLDFIKLLHGIFKRPIEGYPYRAYLIVNCVNGITESIEHDTSFCYMPPSSATITLYLNDDTQINSSTELLSNFKKVEPFRRTMEQCFKLASKSKQMELVLLHIGIVSVLKILKLRIHAIYGSSLTSELIALYFDDIINLNELCHVLSKTDKKAIDVFVQNRSNMHRTKYFQLVDLKKDNLLNLEYKSNSEEAVYRIDTVDSFLKSIGQLYLKGQNFPIDELYETIDYPVRLGTQMLSPLIRWNHSKEWKVIEFRENEKINYCQRNARVSLNGVTYSFLVGHTIDQKILMPASGYIVLIWETLALYLGMKYEDVPVVMKNVRLLTATHLSEERSTEFKIKIHSVSGRFEIEESGSLVATGVAYVPKEKIQFMTERLPLPTMGTNDDVVSHDDIYSEIKLRGYQFTGMFKSIAESNIDGTYTRVKWDNNFIVFLDSLLQCSFLRVDSSILYVPVYIDHLAIDTNVHKKQIVNMTDNTLPAYAFPDLNTIRCGGVEVTGMMTSAVSRHVNPVNVLMEELKFVPHDCYETNLQQSVRFLTQLIVQNLRTTKINTVEVISEHYTRPPLSDYILETLSNIPLIQANVSVIAPKLRIPQLQFKDINILIDKQLNYSEIDYSLVIVSQALSTSDEVYLKTISKCLKNDTFLISRESEAYQYLGSDFTVIEEHTCLDTNEKLVLLRKKSASTTQNIYFQMNDDFNEWLPSLKMLLKSRKSHQKLIIYSETSHASGIDGFVNCLRKEPGLHNTCCVAILDGHNNVPKFDPDLDVYKKQLQKNLLTNIFKNNQWGSYRRDWLVDHRNKLVNSLHSWANTLIRTNVSSLQWIQGPIRAENEVPPEKTFVYTYYTALNFRDVMFLMGKLTPNAIFKGRLEENSVQGVEFAGIDKNGTRVMGMVDYGALSTVIYADKYLLWEVPANWTLEDAATVPVAYVTAMYALIATGNIKKGETILIHLGSGGVGQAAINVALFYGCTVFTTVGTEKKRDFIQKTYPQIDKKHIGNSRDTSFEDMIMFETNGRGVDLVLNSLAAEKLEASVRCLAADGRFLEIGKTDMINNSPLSLEILKRGSSFHSICLGKTNSSIRSLMYNMLLDGIAKGIVKPLTREVFNSNQIEEGVKLMAHGFHIGKILIKLRNENEDGGGGGDVDEKRISDLSPAIEALPRFYAVSDKSVFIIVGGLGGFGLELVDWLVIRGAKKLIIVSRQGCTNGYQKRRVKMWRSYGSYVEINTSDLSNYEECYKFLKYANSLGELQAIFHLAAVLRDAIFENQTTENFETVFKSKVLISRHLDVATRQICPDLKYFILFSSVASSMGNAGQTNYGMANSIMEQISQQRRQDGFSSLAIEWGVVGDVGLAAKLLEKTQSSNICGTLPQPIINCLETLDEFLTCYYGKTDVVSSMVVDEHKLGDNTTGNIVETVAKVLGVKDLNKISLHQTLSKLGMDSMMTMETKQVLEQKFNLFFSQAEIREMTFQKLIEISSLNEQDCIGATKDNKSLQLDKEMIKMIYRMFGDGKYAHEELVTIKCLKTPKLAEVFFIPGIEGISTILESLASKIDARNVCLQLPYLNDDKMITIADIVDRHKHNMEKHLKTKKQFMIVAVSFGTNIALELTHYFEQKNCYGKVVLLDGSWDITNKQINMNYLSSNDKNLHVSVGEHLAERLCLQSNQQNVLSELRDIHNSDDDRENILLKYLPINVPLSDSYIKHIYKKGYARLKNFLDYKPLYKELKSNVLLIKPTSPMIVNAEMDYGLNKYLVDPKKQLKIVTVEGDHMTILDNNQCAKEIMTFFLDK